MPYWTSRSAPLCLRLRPRLVVNTYQRRTIHDTSQVATGRNRSRPFHADLPQRLHATKLMLLQAEANVLTATGKVPT